MLLSYEVCLGSFWYLSPFGNRCQTIKFALNVWLIAFPTVVAILSSPCLDGRNRKNSCAWCNINYWNLVFGGCRDRQTAVLGWAGFLSLNCGGNHASISSLWGIWKGLGRWWECYRRIWFCRCRESRCWETTYSGWWQKKRSNRWA